MFHKQRNNLVIKFRLFNHCLNNRSRRISTSVFTLCNSDCLCQLARGGKSGFTVIGYNLTVICQVATLSAAERCNVIKTSTSGTVHRTRKTGELLVHEVNFHAVNIGSSITDIGFKVCNFLLQFLNITDSCNGGCIHFKGNIVRIAYRGDKLHISTRNGNTIVRGHIAVPGIFDCHGVQDFTRIGINRIQSKGTHIIPGCQVIVRERRFNLDCNLVCAGYFGNKACLLDIGKGSQGFKLRQRVGGTGSANLCEVNVTLSGNHLCNQSLSFVGDNQL